MKKKGIVKVVSLKTGGVVIDDEWFNPSEQARKFVKSDLKGLEVELDLESDGKTFNFIKVLGAKSSSQVKNETGPDWDAKERRIVRQNVLNRAVDMFNAGKIEREEILEVALSLENWVYNHGEDL